MAVSKIPGVKISGIANAVPAGQQSLIDDVKDFDQDEIMKISKSIGVRKRYVTPEHMCTSDLCLVAAERLINELGIDKASIGALIFVTQTPDYILPATSCILQDRLGLQKSCAAFDMNLGCSGYPYGLWIAANFIFSGSAKRILLLNGDTGTKLVSNLDRATAFLFGDAGTATILESCDKNETMSFVLGTDGSGYKNLIIPAGSSRNPSSESTNELKVAESGNIRSQEHLFMNGAEIFTFALKVVAPMIKELLNYTGSAIEDIDYFVMHQANSFIIKHLTKKLKVPSDKVPICMEKFGNTISSSIPLTICETLGEQVRSNMLKFVFAGFGVGYSWAAVELNLGHTIIPDLVIVK